jgi:NAD(P)-dependent dehydrogenase (short-subunit alcohol dehydrogenase family)
MLTRYLAKQIAPANILVNAIASGFFHTKMTASVLSELGNKATRNCDLLGQSGILVHDGRDNRMRRWRQHWFCPLT